MEEDRTFQTVPYLPPRGEGRLCQPLRPRRRPELVRRVRPRPDEDGVEKNVGLFAARRLPEGTLLRMYGKLGYFQNKEKEKLEKEVGHKSLVYVFGEDDDQHTRYARFSGPGAYMNCAHSACANVKIRTGKEGVEDIEKGIAEEIARWESGHVAVRYPYSSSQWSVFVTKRDIEAGEQLTLYYGYLPQPFLCPNPNCKMKGRPKRQKTE